MEMNSEQDENIRFISQIMEAEVKRLIGDKLERLEAAEFVCTLMEGATQKMWAMDFVAIEKAIQDWQKLRDKQEGE